MQKSNNDNNETTITTAEDIYQAALEAGYTKKKAQALSLRKLQLSEKYDTDQLECECSIRRQIPKRYFTEWDSYAGSPEKKQQKLWEMGYDTTRNVWEDICIFRERGRVIVEECVVGDERTDKAWVNLLIEGSHVASFAARVAHKRDPSLERELRKMSGGMYG